MHKILGRGQEETASGHLVCPPAGQGKLSFTCLKPACGNLLRELSWCLPVLKLGKLFSPPNVQPRLYALMILSFRVHAEGGSIGNAMAEL